MSISIHLMGLKEDSESFKLDLARVITKYAANIPVERAKSLVSGLRYFMKNLKEMNFHNFVTLSLL